MVKHQTSISELKRSFLETGDGAVGLTEWEKRLSSSPVRSPRSDEAPMIEPLELQDVSCSPPHVCVEHDAAAGSSITRFTGSHLWIPDKYSSVKRSLEK